MFVFFNIFFKRSPYSDPEILMFLNLKIKKGTIKIKIGVHNENIGELILYKLKACKNNIERFSGSNNSILIY